MGAWRVEQYYGVGAANVGLTAEPYRHPDRPYSLAEGIAHLRADLHSEGGSLRRTMGTLPALCLGLIVLGSFALTMLRSHVDDSGIEVVMWSQPAPVIEAIPEPIPVREPEPAPAPKPVAPPKPPPEPVVIAKAPPPAPPPPVPQRRAEPPPVVRPRVQIDAVAAAPTAPKPAPARNVRNRPAGEVERRPAPDVRPIAVANAQAPTRPADAPRRFAGIRPPKTTSAARPDVAPAIAASALPAAPAQSAPTRTERSRPTPRVATNATARPELAPIQGGLATTAPPAREARAGRSVPTPQARSSAPRPAVQLASLGSQPAPSQDASQSLNSRRGRTATPSSARGGGGLSASGAALTGVPLGSLASCMSDREEDALKQRLVAAVTTQEVCVSRAGTYRFVETKNLNSFLLWVDRAKGRQEGDRCQELRLALECVKLQSSKESH